eukprot:Hpha_TRINITY_DN15141_c0_g1::TRINITY_DN15141_c0_g1_i1::g.128743::m.128743/K15637/PGAM5; serine/threonine-protein phosphatase PGAM5
MSGLIVPPAVSRRLHAVARRGTHSKARVDPDSAERARMRSEGGGTSHQNEMAERLHRIGIHSLQAVPGGSLDDVDLGGGYVGVNPDIAVKRRGQPWGVDWDGDWDGRAEDARSLRKRVGNSLRALRKAWEGGEPMDMGQSVSLVVPPGSEDDDICGLTDRGRQQVESAARRLLEHYVLEPRGTELKVLSSDLLRARETAEIICSKLGTEHCVTGDIREGFPCRPSPCRPHIAKWIDTIAEEEQRRQARDIYGGFLTHFRRPIQPVLLRVQNEELAEAASLGPSWRGFSQPGSVHVFACHTNVIRFFTCCALQLPPEAWARVRLGHGSITSFVVTWDGHVQATNIGDLGFMPVGMHTA